MLHTEAYKHLKNRRRRIFGVRIFPRRSLLAIFLKSNLRSPAMSRKSIVALCAAALFCAVVALIERPVDAQRRQTSSTPSAADSLKVLQWRSIGPYRGGRSTAVAGVASQPMVFYFGGVGGGVWKTSDGGINWEPITDGSVFGTASVGAIGLSDSDPNTIYVGMGESPCETLKHIGLEDTRQIARIRVHPKN